MEPSEFDPDQAPGEVITDEGYDAFNPEPLPPEIDLSSEIIDKLSEADRAIGELSGIGRTIENPNMLIQPFMRKEAVLSSRIEGTQADLSDVYALEAAGKDSGAIHEDTQEVYNYLKALQVGLDKLNETDQQIDLELIRELHRILLDGVRGENKNPGEFRTSQNYIGGPGAEVESARYVPPPPQHAEFSIQQLIRFIRQNDSFPALIQLGLIHYQFETIHPFVDGNGRIGRLLITLLICERNILPDPFLYISSYFNRHRREYIDRMFGVSTQGEWEEWLLFFLQGVIEQAEEAFIRANEMRELKEEYRVRYQDSQSQSLLTLVYGLFNQPVITVNKAAEMADITYQAANNNVKKLMDDGVLEEITGRKRNRFFQATEIYDIIRKPLEELDNSMEPSVNRRQSTLGEYN